MEQWLTTKEIMMLFGVNRDRVSKIARARKWDFETYKSGNMIAKRYSLKDVQIEANRRMARNKLNGL